MTSGLSFLMAARRCEIAGLQQLSLTSALVKDIARLVHALQRERGLSNLYAGSQGARWGPERDQQIASCEALQQQVRRRLDGLVVQSLPPGNGARLFSRIAYVIQGLDDLPRLRARITACSLSPHQITAAFVRLINGLLAVVFEAADTAPDPDISRRLVAMFNFMQGKEFAGQERATGSGLFASGMAKPDEQHHLLELIDSQERCLLVFSDFASDELRADWQRLSSPQVLAELERLRRILGTAAGGAPLDVTLSQHWFDVCTARIDAMKDIEDKLADELLALCEQRLQATQKELALLAQMPPDDAPHTGFFDRPDSVPPVHAGVAMGSAAQAFAGATPVERSILDLVQAQAQRLQRMGDELDTVRASLNERKLIERAKGLLMAHRHLNEDEAHKTLRQMAMNQNRRLVEVAEAVLASAELLGERRH